MMFYCFKNTCIIHYPQRSENLFQSITEYISVHDGANISGHCPGILRRTMNTDHMTMCPLSVIEKGQ